jgi:hypothetical protein
MKKAPVLAETQSPASDDYDSGLMHLALTVPRDDFDLFEFRSG